MSQARNWVYTLNNPTVPLYADLEAYVSRLVVFYQQRMDHFARPPADFSLISNCVRINVYLVITAFSD